MTEFVCPEAEHHGNPFRYCGVKGCGWMEETPPPSGAALIAVERQRQMDVEGWTPEHDDEHADGHLLLAAGSYASYALGQERSGGDIDDALWRVRWPWSIDWWKPSNDPIRNLVKAGALIAAEIDRLERDE